MGDSTGTAKRLQREAGSLGWLSESAVQPKKQRLIEGVGAGGLLELRAQVYRTQEHARLVREGDAERPVRRRGGLDLSGGLGGVRNVGVDDRNRRDAEQLQTDATREADSYAALQRKCVRPQAALYEKLSTAAANDDEEHYNVDFLRKGLLSDEAPGTSDGGGRGSAPVDSALDALGQGGMRSADTDREAERRRWEEDSWRDHDNEQRAQARRDERVEDINELNEQLNYERERAADAKARRAEQQKEARDKLKAQFLKQQVEKLKAAKQRPKPP